MHQDSDKGVNLHEVDKDFDIHEIESWEDYCKNCIKQNKIDVFKKKFNKYIIESIEIDKNDIKEYVVRRLGEFKQQEMEEKIKSTSNAVDPKRPFSSEQREKYAT